MYLGKFQQGDELFFHFRAWRTDPALSLISVGLAYPQFTTFLINGTPTVIEFPEPTPKLMAAYEYEAVCGWFRASILLRDAYATPGSYAIRIRSVCPVVGVPIDTTYYFFEVVANGQVSGSVSSVAEVTRPDTRFLVTGTTMGEIIRRKNPRVPT